jgi:DNA-directed RNA polymerase subunit RPC12/RpoP
MKISNTTFIKTGVGYEWVFNCRDVSCGAYRTALRLGVIKREYVCSECTSTENIHAHHDNYRFPLRVRYLCARCHSDYHARKGAGKNRDAFCKRKSFIFDGMLSNQALDACFDEVYTEAMQRDRSGIFAP